MDEAFRELRNVLVLAAKHKAPSAVSYPGRFGGSSINYCVDAITTGSVEKCHQTLE